MAQTKAQLLDQLVNVAKSLPVERLRQVLDFVTTLQSHPTSPTRSERGTARAVLSHFGAFQLENGELERLLADIELMRMLDLERHA